MHTAFLQQTINLAVKSTQIHKGGPFAAIICRDQNIIATGINNVTCNNDPTAHAEIMAIRNACSQLNTFQLKDCVLYSSCEPCPMCLGAIYWARIKQVYFACNRYDAALARFDDSFIYDEIAMLAEQRKIPMQHIKLKEPLDPFNAWQTQENKIPY
ncbi:tRNA-specific adenosine deaminase [Methylococcaceae bacterium CS4]|nr:tRNA-specific adenosine deaminase [Methylococcaceae bacterium CS4]